MHENDRLQKAKQLGLSLEEFDRLLMSANHAYETIKNLGPFYGKEHIKEPNFRIAAEAVTLPSHLKPIFKKLGDDLLYLGRALSYLPPEYKEMLGTGIDFRVPFNWRIDAILNEKGDIELNEIQGSDGASALMIAEQLAYNLQTPHETTAHYAVSALQKIFSRKKFIKIAYLRIQVTHSNFTANTRRLIEFIHNASKGKVQIDLIDEEDIKGHKIADWEKYDGVINQTSILPRELLTYGIKDEQVLASGDYNALVNKGVFALLFEDKLSKFWETKLGKTRLKRLRTQLMNTTFIKTEDDLKKARRQKQVVKISWAGNNRDVINNSQGLLMPEGDLKHSDENRWKEINTYMKQGFGIITQEYIRPAKIKAYLRKKGTNLEKVEWYNRICVKYVCTDNPNKKNVPNVVMTGVEVTLGPDLVPAGRECAFIAGKFAEEEEEFQPQENSRNGSQFLHLPEE